jgi:hypothetical protein
MFLDDDRFLKKWQISCFLAGIMARHNTLWVSSLRSAMHDFRSYFGAFRGTMVSRLTLEFLAVKASPLNPACALPAEES